MSGADVARYPNLTKRGNVFQIRVHVPSDVRELEGKEHIQVSLRTQDRSEAVKRYRLEHAKLERRFADLRATLASRSPTSVALADGDLEQLDDSQLELLVEEWFRGRETFHRPTVVDGEEADLLFGLRAELADLDDDAIRGATDRLLVDAGYPAQPRKLGKSVTHTRYPKVDRAGRQYRYLATLVRRALMAENAAVQGHVSGAAIALDEQLLVRPRAPTADHQSPNDISVAELVRRYEEEREKTFKGTKKKYGHIFRTLKEVLGADKSIRSITRSDCRDARDFLAQVPTNVSKFFPGLTLREAIAEADDTVPRLSSTTMGTYMSALTALFAWAGKERLLEANPAKELARRGIPTVKRRGFAPDELEILFSALIKHRKAKPEQFWVPALALFSGARAGELCQLLCTDVVAIGKVHCLNISAFDDQGVRHPEKHIKTPSSVRRVPLHPEIIRAGFLEFVSECREAGQERLFPALKAREGGNISHEFSKWFGRFMDSVGLSQPSLVLHSFRHGFRDACRRHNISDEIAKVLGGWATAEQSEKYGDAGMVPVLDRAVSKIAFGKFKLPEPTE